MTDIFISYKSEERALPEALANDLRADGYTVWWDVELIGGPSFRRQILERLEAARAVIVIWTPASVQSEFVLDEADHAKRAGKLIPVRVPEMEVHHIPLGHRQAQTYLLAERTRILGALIALGVTPGAKPSATHVILANGADKRLWAEVRAEDSVSGYSYYLRKFPQGAHAAEADDLIWRACESVGTAVGYKRYLELAPGGQHSAVAEYRLEREEEEEKDRRAGIIRLIKPGSGESFKDIDAGPEMVVVPAGEFLMGSTESEKDRSSMEGPQHRVVIPKPFAIGRYPITFAEWDACVAAGDYDYEPDDKGWGRGDRPVINVNWRDAQRYIEWLRKLTGKDYRLPSEAEWEYAARAGTRTRYSFGDSESALGDHGWNGSNSGVKTHPVGGKKPNAWGLSDVHGNVWEWCQDEWHDSYAGKPDALKSNGGAWTTGDGGAGVLRGGSWYGNPQNLRSAYRSRNLPDYRVNGSGFRVARTLTS